MLEEANFLGLKNVAKGSYILKDEDILVPIIFNNY